ncbi:hypothetical protein [Sulfurospirillum sp. 1612]|uniref:hypothetical protein n=1 Tax=Sulfurospirillum sp. 1612 TaxID=3094835 RepID=UPI002F952851
MQKIILLFLCSLSFAQDNNTTVQNHNYIDQAHSILSNQTESMAIAIDDFIANKIDTFLYQPKNQAVHDPGKADALFQSEKFLNETRKSFIKLSTHGQYNSKDANDFGETISASLALNRSNQKFKLFINNLNSDQIDTLTEKADNTEGKTEIGLSFFEGINKSVASKYSLGTRGFYPFTRARFSYKKMIDDWKIEPVQSFEYSTKDEFKEHTIVYFDKNMAHRKMLFRIEVQRGSSTKGEGMDYDALLHLFWTPNDKEGLQITQGFYGNTKYVATVNDATGETQIFSGINNYLTQITYRRNIWRKWFFYELSPGVNFSKAHDFKPNYRIFAKFDIIFGKI